VMRGPVLVWSFWEGPGRGSLRTVYEWPPGKPTLSRVGGGHDSPDADRGTAPPRI